MRVREYEWERAYPALAALYAANPASATEYPSHSWMVTDNLYIDYSTKMSERLIRSSE